MVLKQVLVALALCAGAKSCGKWNLHLHKVGQQQESMKCSKTSWYMAVLTLDLRKHNGPTPADDMAPQTITDCGKLYTGPQATWFCASPLFLQTLGPWFPKEMQNLLSSENIILDHSAAVQSRRFWRWLWSRVAGHKECDSWNPCLAYVCASGSLALTPAAVHSLWISPTFWMGCLFHNPLQGRLSLLLVPFFLPHLFLPFASLLMCLDTELCEQPDSFAMTFCVLPSLCKVSMVVFWTTVKSAVFPMIV